MRSSAAKGGGGSDGESGPRGSWYSYGPAAGFWCEGRADRASHSSGGVLKRKNPRDEGEQGWPRNRGRDLSWAWLAVLYLCLLRFD